MNKMNTNETLNRMKSLMNYGLQTESKQAPYSTVEYQKKGADGKVYGIVREGAKYYIKSAPNKANLVKEDFNYIGGFRNRKDNEYSSYANAQKQFDLKMMSLKEAYNNPSFNVESWDLNKKETVVTEASDKMKTEILRERQIMKNATMISEAKKGECKGIACDIAASQKDNIKGGKPETGDAKKADDTFCEKGKPSKEQGKLAEGEVLGWNRGSDDYMDKSHGTEIGDSAPFDDATARNIDNQDKKVSKTGEMENGVVEGKSMHDADNQNTPTPGVGEIGDNQPFDGEKGKQIDEAIDDFGDEGGADDMGGEPDDMGGEDPMAGGAEDGADDMGGEDFGAEGDDLGDDDFAGEDDFEGEGFGDEGDDLGDEGLEGEGDDVFEDDLESRMSALEELLGAIADKLGVSAPGVDADNYEDDELFDDEEGDDFGSDEFGDEGEDFGDDDFEGEDFGAEEPVDDEPMGDDFGGEEPMDDEEPIEDGLDFQAMPESRRRRGVQIYETAAFKRAMRKQRVNEEGMTPFTDNGRVPSGNMNKLDDFGKHPAYQKKVMELPPKDLQEFPDYYDMNDDSVKNDTPYGEKIGDGAPFDVDPQAIDNAIAEAFNRLKKNRR